MLPLIPVANDDNQAALNAQLIGALMALRGEIEWLHHEIGKIRKEMQTEW